MIDEKRIEEAAIANSTETFVHTTCSDIRYEGFKAGAKWAINEFLKDLWHPVSEEPREKVMLLIEVSPPKPTLKKFYYTDVLIKEDWEIKCSTMCISRWLYVDDLLPKKGDNIK